MATWSTLSGAYTRAAETLTIPKAAVFDDAMGTFECWVKPLRDAGTNAQYIFDGGGAANKSLVCYIHTDGTLRLIYGTGTADVTLTGTTVLTEQIWHSVAFKWGMGGVSLYYNAVVEDTDTTAPGLVMGANIYIGSKTDGTLQLDGLIDDLRISSISRTNDDIYVNYNSGASAEYDIYTTSKITFDNIDDADIVVYDNGYIYPFGFYCDRDTIVDVMPQTRDAITEKEYGDGNIDFGTWFDNGLFKLNGAIDFETVADRNTLDANIRGFLNTARSWQTLMYECYPDKFTYVMLTGKPEIIKDVHYLEVSADFKRNPFWYDVEQDSVSGTSGSAYCEGTFETPVLIEITGPATNPTVSVGNYHIGYTGTINPATTLYIDTWLHTAKIGSANALDKIEGDIDMVLPPLASSTVVASHAGTVVKWHNRFI